MLNKQINRFTIIIYNNDVGDSLDLGLVLSEQDKCDSGKNQKIQFWYDKKKKKAVEEPSQFLCLGKRFWMMLT